MKYLLLAIRIGLGGLLLYSGLGEIRRPFEFLESVNAYQLTGPVSGVVVAGVVPWAELVVGTSLIAGVLTRGAFLSAIILTVLFAGAIGSAWARGLSISCGCFGDHTDVINVSTLIRSVALVAITSLGTILSLVRYETEQSRFRSPSESCPATTNMRQRDFVVSAKRPTGKSISNAAAISS